MDDNFATLPAPVRRWGKTIVILGGALAAYVVTALLGTLVTGDPIAGAAVSSIAMLVLALVYRWRWTGTLLAGAPAPRALTGQFVLAAIAGLVSCWLFGQTLAAWIYSTIGSAGFDAVNDARSDSPVWLLLLTGVVLAPVGEEALIRGIVFPALRTHWPVIAAAIVSATVFAVLHGNLVQIAVALPLGVLLAIVYEYTRWLWPVIVMHVLFNVASSFVPPELIGAIANPFMIVGFAAMLVLCLYALARRDVHGVHEESGEIADAAR